MKKGIDVRTFHHAWLTGLVVSSSVASARPSLAAEPSAADKETGRSLYAQGMSLLEAHDYTGAERACRGAHAIVKVPTASTCWGHALEGLGRLVEARDAFVEAAHYPEKTGEPRVFTEARDAANAEADALTARIPSLVIAVTGPPDTTQLSATVDGATIAADTARLPRKVDPGRHVIVVSAPGFRQARIEATAVEGHEQRVAIYLEPLAGDDMAAPSDAPGPARVEPASPEAAGAGSGQRVLGLVVGGVGVAGLAVGSIFGLVASSAWSRSQSECVSPTNCSNHSQAISDHDDATSAGTLSTIAFLAGGALVATGAVLFFTAPSKHERSSGAHLEIAPLVAGGSGGLMLRGPF